MRDGFLRDGAKVSRSFLLSTWLIVFRIGHVTAYKLITQHLSIEEILSVYAHKYDFPDDYLDQVKLAREVFFQKAGEVLGDAQSFKLKEPAEDLKLVM